MFYSILYQYRLVIWPMFHSYAPPTSASLFWFYYNIKHRASFSPFRPALLMFLKRRVYTDFWFQVHFSATENKNSAMDAKSFFIDNRTHVFCNNFMILFNPVTNNLSWQLSLCSCITQLFFPRKGIIRSFQLN